MNVLEFTIGSGNKFVFLDDKGDFYILNEKAGEWSEDGAWFSNTSYKRESYKKYNNYTTYNNYGGWADDWYGGYNKPVSNSKTKYKYNKDEFEVEEIVDEVVGQGEGYDYSICDCCNEWCNVNEVAYVRDWNSWICEGCAYDLEVDENEYKKQLSTSQHD
jgi:hypothetical protein